jgi:hypothetical protein
LAKDVKTELDEKLGLLSGKGKGNKGKKLRGSERRGLWEEVKGLRKEYCVPFGPAFIRTLIYPPDIASAREVS